MYSIYINFLLYLMIASLFPPLCVCAMCPVVTHQNVCYYVIAALTVFPNECSISLVALGNKFEWASKVDYWNDVYGMFSLISLVHLGTVECTGALKYCQSNCD